MTATEPIQAGPYPEPSDPPDGPNQMAAIVAWAATRTVMRFATPDARDAALPEGTAVDGMQAWTGTGTTLRHWSRVAGTWRDTTPYVPAPYTPQVFTGAGAINLGAGGTATGRKLLRDGMCDWAVQIVPSGPPATTAADYYIEITALSVTTGYIGTGYLIHNDGTYSQVVVRAESPTSASVRRADGTAQVWGGEASHGWSPIGATAVLSVSGRYFVA